MLERIKAETEFYTGAALSLVISLIVYFMTVAPTVSYWDCGEFIAAAHTLAIPHPPGAPLFLMTAKFFSMFPFSSDIAFRVNILSVLASSFTVLLVYLLVVQFAKSFAGSPKTTFDKYLMYGAAVLGALTYAFTDSFWFNAVETEVYASSTFFAALVIWLTLKWSENRDDLKSIKYLVFIIYFFGLSYGIHLLSFLAAPTIALLIFFYKPKLLLNWRLWSLVPVLFIAGVSTYFLIYIRSGLEPFINENDPSTWSSFMYYLNREQYGTQSLVASMLDRAAPLWEYQLKFMYLRYFSWNFIGKGILLDPARGFVTESFSLIGLKGLPFLTGMVGVFYHFKKDWRKALSLLAFFIFSGILLAYYQNQGDPQPRERDYFYIGSFLAFSIWIGIGSYGILKFVRKWLGSGTFQKAGVALTAAVLLLINPINEFQTNYESHDRSDNYAAWDYSYNMLMTCEKDAILFTNGDNDTFPLWYLQEVEGIRKDVRIVCLSLLNTRWFIYQLKNYEPKLPISYQDDFILNQLNPVAWKPSTVINLPLSPEVLKAHYDQYGEPVPENADTMMTITVEPTLNVGSQTALQLKDIMIIHLLANTRFQRPIYFGETVSPTNFAGLRPYLRLDGLNWKVTPVKNPKVNVALLEDNIMNKFKYRGLNDKNVHLDFSSTNLMINYRNTFDNLARHYYVAGNKEKTMEIQDEHLKRIPEWRVNFPNIEYSEQVGRLYHWGGRSEELHKRILEFSKPEYNIPKNKKLEYANWLYAMFQDTVNAEKLYVELYNENPADNQVLSVVVTYFESTKQYQKAIDKLQTWVTTHPQDQNASNKLKELQDSLKTGGNN